MADNKSCEGKLTTLVCMDCGYREVFTERQFKFTDGLSCYVCNGPVRPVLTRPGEKIRNRRMEKQAKQTTKISIDVTETLKGLKAVQREAKKAVSELKELDSIRKHTCPSCRKISLDIANLIADDEIVLVKKECKDCGWSNV